MTNFQANTTISIYSTQSTVDEIYGTTEDVNVTPSASGLPAGIREGWFQGVRQPQTTDLPTSLRGGVVEFFTIRLRPLTNVVEGNRIYDERNNLWFQVVDVVRPYGLVGYADVRVGAIRVDAVSQPANG